MVTFREFFSFRNNRFFWLNLVGMIAIFIAAAWGTLAWLDDYTRHGEAVLVPPVKGMQVGEAEQLLYKHKLKAVVVDSSYVKGAVPGVILEQNPVGGFKVKEGRTIYLIINTDQAPTFALPDLMDNSSLRQAEAKLAAMGFKLGPPEYISGEKDWVYSIKYKGREMHAGQRLPRESLLVLCVGNGGEMPTDSIEVDETIPTTDADEAVIDKSWF